MAKLVLGTDKTLNIPASIIKDTITVTEKYPLLTRVKDDANNEIGTVFGYRFNALGQKTHACVVADCNMRTSGIEYMSTTVNIPTIYNVSNSYAWIEFLTINETATDVTQKTLDFCSTYGYTCACADYCRSYSLNIDGVTYFWQIPLLKDVLTMLIYANMINSLDTHYVYNKRIGVGTDRKYFTADQNNNLIYYIMTNSSVPTPAYRDLAHFSSVTDMILVPIIEIEL